MRFSRNEKFVLKALKEYDYILRNYKSNNNEITLKIKENNYEIIIKEMEK